MNKISTVSVPVRIKEGGVGSIIPKTIKTLCRGVTSEIILAQTDYPAL